MDISLEERGESLQLIELSIYPQGLSQAYVPKMTLFRSALTNDLTQPRII